MISENKLSFFTLGFLWLLGMSWTAAPGFAARSTTQPPLKKIAIAYSGISPSQSPIWITHEAGFFRKYGLDVQMIFIESGSRAVESLASGDVNAAQVAGAPVIQSNLKGSEIVMIAGLLNTLDYKLVVARDITRPDQLKGKTLAVSRAGGSSDFATRYALDKYGLIPDKDVQLVQIGSQPARFAALESGKIQGVMISIPLTAKAAKAGFNTLADLQMLGLEYQHTGLALSRKVLSSEPELARDILKAFIEGLHFMKTERRETIKILAKYLKTNDEDDLNEVYESEVLALFPQKPYPTIKGIQTILREFGARDPAAREAQPQRFVDLSFIQQLDASGFIDNLYKPPAVTKRGPGATPQQGPSRETLDRTARKANIGAGAGKGASSIGAAPAVPSVTDKQPADASRLHTVKAGESLSKIAEQYYDSNLKWPRIYEANKNIVKNPDYIYIGMKLVIPPDEASGG